MYAKEFGGDDTLITMELCEAPNGTTYRRLEKALNKREKEKLEKERKRLEKKKAEAERR